MSLMYSDFLKISRNNTVYYKTNLIVVPVSVIFLTYVFVAF